MKLAEQAAAKAREALADAMRGDYERRRFTISKFDRHESGYLHARVVVDGKPFYFHRRFGSWLAPGQVGPREVLKEPEALLGRVLGQEVKYALSDKSRPFDNADRKQREHDADRTSRPSTNATSGDPPAAPAGVPEGGDRPDGS